MKFVTQIRNQRLCFKGFAMAWALLTLSFSSPSIGLRGAETEVRGSIFVATLGGAVNFRMSLAKVYLLTQSQAFEMFQANQADLKAYIVKGERTHAEKQKELVSAHNNLIDDFEKRKEACERILERIDARMLAIREGSPVLSRDELQNLSRARSEEVRRYESLGEEAKRLDAQKPVANAWKPESAKSVEIMLRPPAGVEYATRSDADGGFAVSVTNMRDAYILIVPKEEKATLRWFLKLSAMRKDGDKYLFTEENDVWHPDRAQALEMNITGSNFQFRIK